MEYIDGLIDYLVQLAFTIVNALFYPIYKFLEIVYSDIMIIFNAVSGLINAFYNFFDVLYNFIRYFLTSLFPSTWTFLVLLGLTIVISLRIYKFVKDVSLGGFKI